jgi:HD-GYP domain-containing protein (c-di-GMP phosphodiesterase class II)
MTQTLTSILPSHLRSSIESVRQRLDLLGAQVFVVSTQGECLLEGIPEGQTSRFDQVAAVRSTVDRSEAALLQRLGPDRRILVLPLHRNQKPVADLFVLPDPACGSQEGLAAVLEAFSDLVHQTEKNASQIEKISTELAHTYEELMLVYNMSTHMRVTQTYANYLQMACDNLTQLVSVEGIAVFLEKKVEGMDRLVLIAGSGVVTIDQVIADILHNRLLQELRNGAEALLDSQVDRPFKYEWPQSIRNILAVPLGHDSKIFGLMVATNIQNKPDFDSVDIKLFTCVANQCSVFIENGRLFGDLKELFIGSLKALTNSIDAKDRYTRGHSDRVAFISRWIAERFAERQPIDEDQIHQIYLAGLLHDIGKIGISESVLCKKGKLTDEERSRIMAHPRIGASILSDIKQMKQIVPGVLYHHEKIDGSGYPEGLKGDQIPLVGKIISLADAFDAMTSRRVYRDAMTIKKACSEIEKGLGTHFDAPIGRIFLESDIRKLWDIIQDGFIESWDYSNFSEYGAVAVGTLIQ